MERYLMYLRKSRMDTDFDEISVEETLNRHRRILESFCKERRLNVVDVLEEVVSGESLSSRPKMLRLLELVNTGMYAGVICIDIERLSRGSSLESGYIMQVLQTNNCKIITPSKIYDLQNESDEQFTDMKFMFSRYELKTITKRLVRGRNQSASEGKFLGSVAPYGYRAYKLVGMKGNSLRIEPKEAKVVRMIFDMYFKVIDWRFFILIVVAFVISFYSVSPALKNRFYLFPFGSIKQNIIIRHFAHSEFRIPVFQNAAFQRHIPDTMLCKFFFQPVPLGIQQHIFADSLVFGIQPFQPSGFSGVLKLIRLFQRHAHHCRNGMRFRQPKQCLHVNICKQCFFRLCALQ